MKRLATAAAAAALVACATQPAPRPPTSRPTSSPTSSPSSRPAPANAFFRGDLDQNRYFGSASRRELEALQAERPDDPLVLCRLSAELLQQGQHAQALQLLERASELSRTAPTFEGFEAFVTWRLALTSLRIAEVENCIALHSPESCIFPLQGRALHVSRRGAELSRRHLRRVLELKPEGDLDWWRARWLLNVAAMALGEWPEGVPEDHRLVQDPFASAPASLGAPFRNVAEAAGLQGGFRSGGSLLLEDLDGDEQLDVLVSDWLPDRPLGLYRNAGGGTFREATAGSGLEGQTGGVGLYQADYDNDGRLDVLVIRGGQPDPEETPRSDDGRLGRPSLLRNLGQGRFEDVSAAAGLGELYAPWSTAAWADFDGDGHVDLYLGSQSDETRFCDQLLQNQGDGTFRNVAPTRGVLNARHAMAAVWGDVDDDGDPDLFVANYGGPNRLYRNEGTHFDEVGSALGLAGNAQAHGAWFLDADEDGRLDLLVTSYAGDSSEAAAQQFGEHLGASTPHLYLNRGSQGFQDASASWGLDQAWASWSGSVGDVDGDGRDDFYLGTGGIDFDSLFPNALLVNTGSGFRDEATAMGVGHLQKASGVALGDVDGDGDVDVAIRAGGCYPADAFMNVLFENPGHDHRWLSLRLEGASCNRAAIGARLTLTIEQTDGTSRELHRWISSGGNFGSSSLRADLGLGAAARLVSVEVRWPGGDTETFAGAPLDACYRLVQGQGLFQVR